MLIFLWTGRLVVSSGHNNSKFIEKTKIGLEILAFIMNHVTKSLKDIVISLH